MDIGTTAHEAIRVLTPALPFLLAGGKKAAEAAVEKLGEDVYEKAKVLWRRLRGDDAEASARLRDAAADVADMGNDRDAVSALRLQVRKRLGTDDVLLADVENLIGGSVVQTGDGVQVIGSDGRAVGLGAIVERNRITGDLVVNIYRGMGQDDPPADLTAATTGYLEHLIERYQNLDFRGMGVTDRAILRMPLREMYVPLSARLQMPEGETWARDLKVAGRKPGKAETEAMGERLSEPKLVAELIGNHGAVVVLGDPGAGKTTLLKYLTLTLAAGEGGAVGLEDWLPVLVPLAAYANALAEGDVALESFIERYHRERSLNFPLAAMLRNALARGGAMLLFDGLDEVRSARDRHTVVNRIHDFYSVHREAGNRFVLTSRIVGYPEVRLQATDLVECTIVDFEDDDIEAFIGRWTAAIERAATGEGVVAREHAATEQRELLAAVRHNQGVRKLAANPLLLTILALMKRQGVSLPERRVELYRNYINVLIKHWHQARGLGGRGGSDGAFRAAPDLLETQRILAPLALWMHEMAPGGVSLVGAAKVRRQLEVILSERGYDQPEDAARQFLSDVREHAGLLIDRGGGQLGFLHLTFQEYLTAVAIAYRAQEGLDAVVEILAAHVGEPSWEEVTRLTIGELGVHQGRDEDASAVLEHLLRNRPGPPGAVEALVGRAVNDVWPGGVTAACRKTVGEALVVAMRDDQRVPARQRAEAGTALGALGDPRQEVTDVDAMHFCWVPPGAFSMGSDKNEKDSLSDEEPRHTVHLDYGYWMGRFPITAAHYAQYTLEIPDADEPHVWSANAPVAAVSWHGVRGFCAWLTKRWRAAGLIGDSWSVHLPSEAEWEKAARGGHQIPEHAHVQRVGHGVPEVSLVENLNPTRAYPWGDANSSEHANYDATEINRVSAVGCFPSGVSPHGCEELSGNVWEWTRSLKKAYEYQFDDGREDPESKSARVLRGGAYFYDSRYVRCALRYWYYPANRDEDVGFRVVLSPFFSEP